MRGSRGSAADCPVGGVFPVKGLPSLPEGLGGILSSSDGSWLDIVDKVHSKRERASKPSSFNRGDGDAPRGHSCSGSAEQRHGTNIRRIFSDKNIT